MLREGGGGAMNAYNDSEHKRDYPEVQFTLAGDEGKTPEELEEEIKNILFKRDLSEIMWEAFGEEW